jgi:RNA polymerase-interacting CarD/CdnL/TRCF family regulator
MGFRRGDLVVCPKYGVGKVMRAEERPVFGRRQRCLEIRFSADNRRVFLHEQDFQRAHIRSVMEPRILDLVYRTLRDRPQYGSVRVASHRTERYRTKTEIGDPMSLAEVARDLRRRSRHHRLNEKERELAESAVGLLCQEIAVVENRHPGEVREKIDRILER